MEPLLNEQKYQKSGSGQAFRSPAQAGQENAVKIGKILNVKKVIAGSYSKYGDRYVVTVNMVDVETGEIIKSFGQEVAAPEKLREACKILALKLSL